MLEFAYLVIGILVIVTICLCYTIRSKNRVIEEKEKFFKCREEEESAKVKADFLTLHKALVSQYGERYLYDISGAQESDFVGTDMLPHSYATQIDLWQDKYTFYLGGYPDGGNVKYHHRSCRFANSHYPMNAANLKQSHRYRPCMLCPCRLPDTSWFPKYAQYSQLLRKYIHDEQILFYRPTASYDYDVKVNYRGSP